MASDIGTLVVRFENGTAVQRFQEAKDLIDTAQEDAPWNDDLRKARECLEEAWNGLTFRSPEH